MRVSGRVTQTGFEGITLGGESVPVVFAGDADAVLGPFVQGETIRVIGGAFDPKLPAFTLVPRSEVFHVAVQATGGPQQEPT